MSDARRGGKPATVARRIALEVVGWTLVIVGLAALVLPGPGLLCIVAGLAVLSQQYEWAERRLEPVKVRAFRAAAEGVQTWPRIMGSCLGAVLLAAVGVFWGLGSDAPGWWPVGDSLWLVGGWGTGSTMILSALFALGFIVYSFRRFRGVDDPQAAAERDARD
ncbi:PGPGW domain-containing protein [Aeromicrobium sp.]|uniref:PGPGW domain-containing protein n=1 Tax=Aeromicrobium sp. TaxID=1871063 RepID=UPI0019C16F88|nr:PGPGW domain-containing protein [Aeromicrobium sp.]MBC7632917.1 PGPGW domain-containing protein [Aeromicrobium sp.]